MHHVFLHEKMLLLPILEETKVCTKIMLFFNGDDAAYCCHEIYANLNLWYALK